MKHYLRFSDGVCVGVYSTPEGQTPDDGCVFVEVESVPATLDLVLVGGVVQLSSPPAPNMRYSQAAGVYIPDVERLERLWRDVRSIRERILSATDWIVTRAQEHGAPVPPEWVAYRQALRDITEQPDPENIVWPEPPST